MINVSRPFLPPVEAYRAYLKDIWSRDVLTNNGPLVRELEQRLMEYLKLENILYLANGTVALQLALKALAVKGEVITTPFSYVATVSSVAWENCTPVFVDIDEENLNINTDLIERRVTEATSAILVPHVFGNPCNIEVLENIAEKHGLKLIFDAAHCFGTGYRGRSVLDYGDASCISFHATKLFHTIEGGGVVSASSATREKLFHMRNFGHAGFFKYKGIGINGKNSEFHAAMGLCNLGYIDSIMERYRDLSGVYDSCLDFSKIKKPTINRHADFNYSYYPVIFKTEKYCLAVIDALEAVNISPRRYFYPPLNTLDYVEEVSMPVAENVSARILCLPLYYDLDPLVVEKICNCINGVAG